LTSNTVDVGNDAVAIVTPSLDEYGLKGTDVVRPGHTDAEMSSGVADSLETARAVKQLTIGRHHRHAILEHGLHRGVYLQITARS
jgi:hypothetical protein